MPDWVDLRFGTCNTFPDGVAYPTSEAEVKDLLRYAQAAGATVIPYGGGTSVVGHINPIQDDRPTLTVDLPALLHCYQNRYAGAMYSGCGGGYLYVVSDEPVPGGFRIKVRCAE